MHRIFLGKALEGAIHAHRRLAGGKQQFGRDLVGGGFLNAGEGGELRCRDSLAQAHRHHADFARAGQRMAPIPATREASMGIIAFFMP